MAKKVETSNEKVDINQELILIGHLIKYNIYLLFKGILFHAISQKSASLEEAIAKTNLFVNELDLDTKRRLESKPASEEPKK